MSELDHELSLHAAIGLGVRVAEDFGEIPSLLVRQSNALTYARIFVAQNMAAKMPMFEVFAKHLTDEEVVEAIAAGICFVARARLVQESSTACLCERCVKAVN